MRGAHFDDGIARERGTFFLVPAPRASYGLGTTR
jgi:hypothetical protein